MFRSSNQRQFQKGLDTEQSRLNRRDSQLSLRRKAREEHLQKRMRMLTNRDGATASNGVKQPTLDKIPQYVAHVMQVDSIELQLSGVQSLRMLLSQERNPPIKRVCECGVVPKIVSLLHNPNDTNSSSTNSNPAVANTKTLAQKLQFEAAWVVTNIASSDYCNMLVKLGTIPRLVEMSRHTKNPDNQDMAIWGLGNIAGENKDMSNMILKTGWFDDVVQQIPTFNEKVLGNTCWVLSNLIRNSSKLTRDRLVKLIHIAMQLLRSSNDQDVLTNMLWCLAYLSNDESQQLVMSQHGVIDVVTRVLGQETQIYERSLNRMKAEQQKAQSMYNQGGSQRQANQNMVVESQKKMNHAIFKPCLRFLGNVLSGEDSLAQIVLDAGYLDLIEPFVNHFCNSLRKEVIWSISNILAGSHQQIEAVLSRDHIVESIIHAGRHGQQPIKREATWCIGNATVDAVSSQIKKMANFGAIEVLCNMLNPVYDLNDENVKVIVEALDAFLKVYGKSGYNPYADQVEEYKGLDFLEDRQAENNIGEDTYNAIVELMKKYWSEGNDFGDDHDDDFVLKDQLAAQVDNNTNTFVFGCGTAEKNMSILGHNTVNQVNREASNVNMYAF